MIKLKSNLKKSPVDISSLKVDSIHTIVCWCVDPFGPYKQSIHVYDS